MHVVQPLTNQNRRCSVQLSETERMAVIINTAMEEVIRAACEDIWPGRLVEILPQILRTFCRKCVTWIRFVPAVGVNCNVHDLCSRKVDKTWTKRKRKKLMAVLNTEERLCCRII